MRNYLVIKGGVVLDVVSKVGAFEPTDTLHDHDTLGEDPSGKFKSGDVYTIEKWQEYNTPPKTLQELKAEKLLSIESWRLLAEQRGMKHTFGATEDVVQVRNERDLSNINGRVSAALVLKGRGVTDPVLPFRAQSNTTHNLTPDEMIDMGMAVGEFTANQYIKAWALKEQVEAAQTEADLELIAWPA